ncbi:MAG: hypothetical protein HKP09_05870 [Enterobacterales bacterium]|nr:hypothetical protein [Enterobacterales bacterium]
MVSKSSAAIRPDYYSNSVMTDQISEALKSIEAVLFEELSEMYLVLHQQTEKDLELLKNVAELQCALDIVQSAKTRDEKAEVYDILQHMKQPAAG